MKINLTKTALFAFIGFNILGSSFAASSIFAANNNNGNNITICHATSANSNPYIVNTPNANGNVSGHDDHDGPIWPLTNQRGDWGDIIPPFSYNSGNQTLQYAGQNWTVNGQSIWNNGCNIPGATVTPTATPTSTPTSTPTPTPTVTPTPSPTPSATPSPTPSPTPFIDECLEGCGQGNLPTPTLNPTPSPTPTPSATPNPSSSNNNSQASNDSNNNSTPQGSTGQVLGATTLASTGSAIENLMTILTVLGIVFIALGAAKYAKEKNS